MWNCCSRRGQGAPRSPAAWDWGAALPAKGGFWGVPTSVAGLARGAVAKFCHQVVQIALLGRQLAFQAAQAKLAENGRFHGDLEIWK